MSLTTTVQIRCDLPEPLASDAREAALAALAAFDTVVEIHGSVTLRHGDWHVTVNARADRLHAHSPITGDWNVALYWDDDLGEPVAVVTV